MGIKRKGDGRGRMTLKTYACLLHISLQILRLKVRLRLICPLVLQEHAFFTLRFPSATPEISQFLLFDFLFAPWDHVKKHLAQPDSSWNNKPLEHESGRKFLDILTIPFLEFVKQRCVMKYLKGSEPPQIAPNGFRGVVQNI
jgi:hypothetical protein